MALRSFAVKIKVLIVAVLSAATLFVAYLFSSSSLTEREINEVLSSTIVPHISSADAPVGEAVAVIFNAIHDQHPGKPRIPVVVVPPNTLANYRLTCELRDIPAGEALEYITFLTGMGMERRGATIYFWAPPTPSGKPPPLTAWDHIRIHADALHWELFRLYWNLFRT